MEHDGFSSFSHLSLRHSHVPTVRVRYYPIQPTLGDTLVEAPLPGLSGRQKLHVVRASEFEGYTGYRLQKEAGIMGLVPGVAV